MIYYADTPSTLSSIVTAAGDTVLLRSGQTYPISSVPTTLLSQNNITLGYYGTGALPIISGGVIGTGWVFDAPNNVFSLTFTTETLGNITENGVPMRFVTFTTNIATTAALMTAGSFSVNFPSRIIYIKPTTVPVTNNVYVISANVRTSGLDDGVATSRLLIDGISLNNISRHGILLYNKRRFRIQNCILQTVGGAFIGSVYMGNGIELGTGNFGGVVENCQAFDIFDTGFSSQLYEGAPASLSDHTYQNCSVDRYGMHGVEISTQTANQRIYSICINKFSARNAGIYSWAGDRNGAAITFLSNSLNSSRVFNSFAFDITSFRGKRLYLGLGHGGVCGIDGGVGVESWGGAPVSDNLGVSGQSDLFRNVTDNLGAPSGGRFQAVTGNLRDQFSCNLR